ncbi:flagellar hook-basal body complex protein [uncultured Desulfovibrio sp.]|uniref:flagellar hook protein FlgE n=1 Tax=uncultured Desulfovibrio sp. TaxID=167968 RepID=UPI0026309353|nr:flagellar hook-basal body complex protein [uncultured Desulfovibrio sp.]
MNSALYIGATGMKALSTGMQVVSNNIANTSTIGYKQQSILFSDIMYTTQAGMGGWWDNQEDSKVALGQTGHGVQVDTIRTIFTQGNFETSNTVTDLALNGKGYFQVVDDTTGVAYYTRAGDFITDNEGYLRNPQGYSVSGYRYDAQGNLSNAVEPIQMSAFQVLTAKPTSQIEWQFNLGFDTDKAVSEENPYFALQQSYNATANPPISNTGASYQMPITLYDAEGNPVEVTAYFDRAPSDANETIVEFVLASSTVVDQMKEAIEDANREDPDNPQTLPDGAGLLMSGTLHFNSDGTLKSMSAFTPTEAGNKDLTTWTPANIAGGVPQFTLNGQSVGVNFGITSGGWINAPASAAEVGADDSLLPGMGADAVVSNRATTAFAGNSYQSRASQDGYTSGRLTTFDITTEGDIVGYYSNGQNVKLWEIPVCRFTAEDNLYREGNNLFSATEECGQMEMGRAGTENYGTIHAYNIEGSNVDLSTEMVNMIITQRGFQSNSKAVTTADAMLQKAMEIKRS